MDDLRQRLVTAFTWRSDPPVWPETRTFYADYSSWWRDPEILGSLGPALAGLHESEKVTVVMGPQSRGSLLGVLVATHLGVGFAEVRKSADRASDTDRWWTRKTPPDYRDRHVELAVRRSVLRSGDRVLFVDDWVATGGQALGCRQIVEDAGASWVGAAVVVDAIENASDRRHLAVRALVHERELRGR